MTSLLSLPVLAPGACQLPVQASPQLRRRAARALAGAIGRGAIAPTAVRKAMAAGDRAVASLMLANHALRYGIHVPTQALRVGVDGERVQALLDLLRSLVEAGRVPAEALAHLRGGGDLDGLIAVVATHLQLPAACHPAHTIDADAACCPFAVFTSFEERVGGYTSMSTDTPSVVLEVTDYPLFHLPHALQGDDRSAVLGALEAVSRADTLGLIATPMNSLFALAGYLVEHLMDLSNRVTWSNGRPKVGEEDVVEMVEEFGYDCDPAVVAEHLIFLRRVGRAVAWRHDGPRMKRWLADRPRRPVVRHVRRLLEIAEQVACVSPRQGSFEAEADNDAASVFVMEQPPGPLALLDWCIESYAEQETPAVRFWPTNTAATPAQNASDLWKLRDCVVMAAGLMTEVGNVVQRIEQSEGVPRRARR